MRKIIPAILMIFIPSIVFAGTGYIPIWQHGSGVTFYCIMYNTDTRTVTAEVTLYDVVSLTTYSDSGSVAPGTTWSPFSFIPIPYPSFAFGWGYMTSTGDPGTAFGWGAVEPLYTAGAQAWQQAIAR